MVTMLDLLVKSTALLALVWIASLLLRRRAAAERHVLWCAGVAAVALLPLVSVLAPSLRVPVPAGAMEPVLRIQIAATAKAAPEAALPAGPPAAAPVPAAGHGWNWQAIVLLVWAAGTLAAVARVAAGAALLARLRRGARAVEESPELDLAARELGFARPVRLLETDRAGVPLTAGVVRPTIYLPAAAREWDAERRRVVLLHELAHIRRHDALTGFAARIALAAWWWQPLAWVALAAMLRERERAADDAVLAAGTRPSDYAGHLLELAAAFRGTRGAEADAAICIARPSQLEGRLSSILDASVRRGAVRPAFVAATALAVAMLTVPLAAVRAQSSATVPATAAEMDQLIRTAIAGRDHATLEHLAAELVKQRRYEEAEKPTAAALEARGTIYGTSSPEYAEALVARGRLQRLEGQVKQAEESYRRARQIEEASGKTTPATLEYLAVSAHRAKDYAKAKDLYQQALALAAGDAGLRGRLLIGLGHAEADAGDAAGAEAHYREAGQLLPEDTAEGALANEMLARLLENDSRPGEARPLKEAAARTRALLVAQGNTPLPGPALQYARNAGLVQPRLARKTEPQYTEIARNAKLQGVVVLYVEVAPDGIARNIQVRKSLGLGLDEAAAGAVRSWRFHPATKDGVPVTCAATVEVNFRLQ